MPVATATLSDSTVELIGSDTRCSTRRETFGGQASALVADEDSEPRGRCHLLQWGARRIGAPEGNGVGPEERIELGPGRHQCRAMKERAHRTSDDFRVPEVNRARHRDDGAGVEGGGGPQDRTDVAGILDRVEHDQAGAIGKDQIGESPIGNLADGEDTLRRVGLGRAGELAFVDLGQLDAAATGGCRGARTHVARRPAAVRRGFRERKAASEGAPRRRALLPRRRAAVARGPAGA